jgi:hypothetical protein
MRINDESDTSGEPIRCQLIPLPSVGSRLPPPLAIDVAKDAIWVIDPNTNALIASAWLAQVTAVPAKYTYRGLGEYTATEQPWATPILVVHIPGLQPLSIRVPLVGGSSFWNWRPRPRFTWRGKLPPAKHPSAVPMGGQPAYSVTDAEWLTLVEKFGLTPYLERHDK